MKMSTFDKWLTTDPTQKMDEMSIVELEGMVDYHQGAQIPTYVDELECEDCNKGIAWSSDGTFTEFYTDEQERHYKCEDCHSEWLHS